MGGASAASRAHPGAGGGASAAPALQELRSLVGAFAVEVQCLPSGAGAADAAERLLCRFLRQGLETLTVAALMDPMATVKDVSLSFTGPMLRRARGSGPCAALERRCQSLLQALAETAAAVEDFMSRFRDRLRNKAAAEWRGCDESLTKVARDAAAASAPASAAAATSADAGAAAEGSQPSQGPQQRAPSPSGYTCPFAGAVAQAEAAMREKGGEAGALVVASAASKVSTRSDVPAEATGALVQRGPATGALQRQAGRPGEGGAYRDTEEWRKVRASCVTRRLCVDFNRDAQDVRCVAPDGQCSYAHLCAICGAEDRGGPKAQYLRHGGWNCPCLPAWLMSHH
mmetsp:Transcript_22303/g.58770  ORF Transcript_22303/g.58770 Transcript_22303/m.58770 type:complete len:343 (+) Transcript_22303:1-1029(+)